MAVYTKPYDWRIPQNFPNKAILNYKWRERKTNTLIFMQGHSLPYDTGNPHMRITLQDPQDYDLIFHSDTAEEKLEKYDVLPNNAMGGLTVNRKVLNFFEMLCPNDFQAFPIIIRNENPKLPDFENHDYFLINITNTIDAIDQEQSIIKYDEDNEPEHISSLRLKEDCMGPHHISRIQDYHPIVLVSPTLVSLFKKEKVTGVRFLKDYESYP